MSGHVSVNPDVLVAFLETDALERLEPSDRRDPPRLGRDLYVALASLEAAADKRRVEDVEGAVDAFRDVADRLEESLEVRPEDARLHAYDEEGGR